MTDKAAKIIWEVWYTADRRPDRFFGTYRTPEAAAADADRMNRKNLGPAYEVRPKDVTGAWEAPRLPAPAAKYAQTWKAKPSRPGAWNTTTVDIMRVTDQDTQHIGPAMTIPGGPVIASYERNYPGTPPFAPFRQDSHDYALISPHYTATSVMDLGTGKIIAAEKPDTWGFCPVGLWVPDWTDVHDESEIPGSHYWDDKHDRWPDGTLGFVWGCVWGDDNGWWKIQALDLSRITEGIITRDDRFGYQPVETHKDHDPDTFIRVEAGVGNTGPRVTFAVPRLFDLTTGSRLPVPGEDDE